MQEKEPLYFTKFREHIDNKLETHVPVYFREFREEIEGRFNRIEERFNGVDRKFEEVNTQLIEINDKLDSHFEEIGELKVEVTRTNMLLMKKADQGDLEKIEKRTKKLESVVFA